MMGFYDVLAQVIEILQREGRTSYRALKRQFELDEDYLDDLKIELIEVKQVAAGQDQKGLVWAGDSPGHKPDILYETDRKTRFHTLLPAVTGWLQRERRVTYSTLKYVFSSLDDTLLEELRRELAFKRLAIDEDGAGLVWLTYKYLNGDRILSPFRYLLRQ